MVKLSLPAIRQVIKYMKHFLNLLFLLYKCILHPAQVLFLAGGLTQREEEELVQRIERSATRYDHSSQGELSVREWLNVIKIQNKVDISLSSVRWSH